jgi:hypothetical protein
MFCGFLGVGSGCTSFVPVVPICINTQFITSGVRAWVCVVRLFSTVVWCDSNLKKKMQTLL